MRAVLLGAGVAVGLVSLVACGGGSQTPPTTSTTMAPAANAPKANTAGTEHDDSDYELDVIAEAEPDEGAPPLKVEFTASVEEETGGPFTFAWDFGDGQKSTEQNPVHTYEKVGEYTATLEVTNQKGNKGTDEIDIFVETDEEAPAE